jgi:hypothetical protein
MARGFSSAMGGQLKLASTGRLTKRGSSCAIQGKDGRFRGSRKGCKSKGARKTRKQRLFARQQRMEFGGR